MKPFLANLAEYIFKNVIEKNNSNKTAVIFPSRRAGLLLKKEIGRIIDKPIWLPEIFTINDFFYNYSGYIQPNKTALIIKLFLVYSKYEPKESFDSFYRWGDVLLNDFDEADKSLTDTSLLFKRIIDIKEIDDRFPNEFKDEFIDFWKLFLNKDLSGVKSDFLKIWQIISNVYSDFKAELDKTKIAYEGMAYRKVCDDLISNKSKITSKFEKIIFAGFNSLSPAEKKLIEILNSFKIAEIIIDADRYYLDDDNQEAGKNLRSIIKSFPDFNDGFITDELRTGAKIIESINVPLQTGMVKATGAKLAEYFENEETLPESTAVVLPDESLLLPLLNSIPDSVKHINISMGFPMKFTPVYDLLLLIKNLQSNVELQDNKIFFYHKDVEKILLHPYVQKVLGNESEKFLDKIRKQNLIYPNMSIGHLFLDLFFCNLNSAEKVTDYLKNIFSKIAETFSGSDNMFDKVQLEFIFNFYTNLNTITELFLKNDIEVSSASLMSILTESVLFTRIPFTGEPFKGVQILGLLETRMLDYDNVIILSVNEGKFPKYSQSLSFIPYVLRKYFSLPLNEQDDSAFAYYYYRLIQRANNVCLIYNSEIDESYKGKSRFLMQTEFELLNQNNGIEYRESAYSFSSPVTHSVPIEIQKTEEIVNKLIKKEHSPSRLISYIQCPLKFYFEMVEELKEPDEVEESFEANTFGTIYHSVMEKIFNKGNRRTITSEIIEESIIKNLDSIYEDLFSESLLSWNSRFKYSDPLVIPRNSIYKDIIKVLVKKTLTAFKNISPFTVIASEETLKKELNLLLPGKEEIVIKLKGTLDNIIDAKGITHIIDYKTGKKGIINIKDKYITEEIQKMFETINSKEKFQTMFYAYLLKNNLSKTKGNEKINAGIFYTKSADNEFNFLFSEYVREEVFEEFEINLKNLFIEILDFDIPFTQTGDENNCSYCSFLNICHRTPQNYA